MPNSGLDSTTVHNDGWSIVTSSCHETSWHILVASWNGNIAIVMLGLDNRLNTSSVARIGLKTLYHNNLIFWLLTGVIWNKHCLPIRWSLLWRRDWATWINRWSLMILPSHCWSTHEYLIPSIQQQMNNFKLCDMMKHYRKFPWLWRRWRQPCWKWDPQGLPLRTPVWLSWPSPAVE